METREVLKEFLDKKFNGVDFTENDLSFLEQYSIKHDKKESQCIKEFKYEKNDTIYKTVTGYYKANPCVEEAKKTLQNFRKTFNNRLKKDENAFDNNFEHFILWRISQVDVDGKCYCCYCGIDDATASAAFDKNVLTSKKFSGSFHVERLDPKGGYNSENCKLACSLCNNAKSDMVKEKDFKKYIAPGIKEYWGKIKEELSKK